MLKKYFLITYGCQMNKNDSERIAMVLENTGYKLVENMEEADLIVINMCSVRQSAVDRVFGQSRKFPKLKKINPKLKTLLTGCILKKDFKKLVDNFDFILAIKTLEQWQKILKNKSYVSYPDQRKLKFNEKFNADYFHLPAKLSNNFSGFVPISTGCNNFCSYCVVPYTRGPLICRSHKDILEEVRNFVKKGVKEIWLLGQNVNDYHSLINSSINFSELLKRTAEIPGNFWIRFTSPNPKDFSDQLIDTMAKYQKITEYLNLPVQSGDNEILKKMKRAYTIEKYKNLVKKIREKIPQISLSTDVIVGFPGETKKQFENTVRLFKEIKYDMAYIAKYSPRAETTAFKLKDDISCQEKERRHKVLTEILNQTAMQNNQKYIGKKVEALIDESGIINQKLGIFFGKTKAYKTVKIQSTINNQQLKNKLGQFVRVKILKATPFGLRSTLV